MDALLKTATAAQQDMFRRMYNFKGVYARDVDGVPLAKMDWAFMQIENGLKSADKNKQTLAIPGDKDGR